jgi:hypothetical protein
MITNLVGSMPHAGIIHVYQESHVQRTRIVDLALNVLSVAENSIVYQHARQTRTALTCFNVTKDNVKKRHPLARQTRTALTNFNVSKDFVKKRHPLAIMIMTAIMCVQTEENIIHMDNGY